MLFSATKLFRVLTDDFIGDETAVFVPFLCKIGARLHPRTSKVLNRHLLLKNRLKCRVRYSLVDPAGLEPATLRM